MSTAPTHDSSVVISADEAIEAAPGWGEGSGALMTGEAEYSAAETPVTPYLVLKAEANRVLALETRLELTAVIWLAVAVLLTRIEVPTTTEPGETEVMLTWARVRLRRVATADCTSALKAAICAEMLL